MYDPGDTVMLAVNTFDATNTLADATPAPTLRITKPDGTVLTPAPTVVHASTGTYTFAYADAISGLAPGNYGVYWDSAGTLLSAYADSFLVIGADQFLISLAEAKAAIGADRYTAANADDEDLRSLIAGCRPIMEDICGPILPTPIDEWHDGGGPTVMTFKAPLLSVTTVTESYGSGYVRTLTNQPVDGGAFDSFGYTVDLKSGLIIRRTSGIAVAFARGHNNIRVTGVGGRAVMPANIARATRRLVRYLWQTEKQGQRQQGSRPEATAVTESGYLVPRAVIAWCGDEARTIGLA